MIETKEVHLVVCKGELAIGEKEGRIARDRLIKEIDRFQYVLRTGGAESCGEHERSRATVEIERGDISCRRLRDRCFLVRRKLCLKLICDGLRDFALDGEHVIDWPIVAIRPFMRVSARID